MPWRSPLADAGVRGGCRHGREAIARCAEVDAAGLRGPLRTAVLEPFLAGVVAEAEG
jgi:hypothetical protein